MYVLMGFKALLSKISLNNVLSSKSNEYILLYPLEVGVGATHFGIRRTVFRMVAGGTVESSAEFEMEGR